MMRSVVPALAPSLYMREMLVRSVRSSPLLSLSLISFNISFIMFVVMSMSSVTLYVYIIVLYNNRVGVLRGHDGL